MSLAPVDITDRSKSLSAFDKINCAIKLIEEAVKECPNLDGLQMGPLLRTLSAGLQILSEKDSQLKLPDLMVKHGWSVGQRFFVRVSVLSVSECLFSVKQNQDIPEGVVIYGNKRNLLLEIGENIAVDLEIRRHKTQRVFWHIRAIDRE